MTLFIPDLGLRANMKFDSGNIISYPSGFQIPEFYVDIPFSVEQGWCGVMQPDDSAIKPDECTTKELFYCTDPTGAMPSC